MAATLLDVEAVRARFSSLRDGGFVFLDAPGGSQVPDEVGDAIARTLREASANIGATYETSKRVEQILATAREDAARFLGCSSDDVIFGTNMTWLDFALSRTAARDWQEGDRILVSRLDHDGGVAPWVELAADRGFEVEWVNVTEDLRLDYDDLANRLDERVRVVACVGVVERDRDDRRRRAGVGAGARGRRAVLGRRRAVRGARADRRAGARLRRLHRVRVQVLRAAPRARVRPARPARVVAPVQGASGRVGAGRPPLRGRDGAVRAARRLLRDARVPRVDRRDGGDRRLRARARRSASSTACRTARPSTGCRRWRAASPRS